MTINEERHYLDVLGDELALALGKAIWSFANIELLTYQYMKRLSRDELDVLMGDVSFVARTKVMKNLVLRTQAPQQAKDQAIKYIIKAEELAKDRNTIVHNPWSIWIDLDQRNFMTEIQKYTNRDKKFDLSKVRDFTARAQQVASDLTEALNALTSHSTGR